ncbi:MAG TPA: hypothetical protein DCX91_08720 [Stenotrophomonas sp.]|nr:hypothetical protein [Stenotrophomonas sp.]
MDGADLANAGDAGRACAGVMAHAVFHIGVQLAAADLSSFVASRRRGGGRGQHRGRDGGRCGGRVDRGRCGGGIGPGRRWRRAGDRGRRGRRRRRCQGPARRRAALGPVAADHAAGGAGHALAHIAGNAVAADALVQGARTGRHSGQRSQGQRSDPQHPLHERECPQFAGDCQGGRPTRLQWPAHRSHPAARPPTRLE